MARRLDPRCAPGGICKLLDLIQEHPAELTFDFRSRFALSLQDIGKTITYMEAIYLASVLLKDPSSWTQAAKNDWDYPVDRNWIISSHAYDLLAMVNSKKKPKPYPRPWPDANVNRLRPKKAQRRVEVLEKLRLMNPKD